MSICHICGAPAKWRLTRTGFGNVANARVCAIHIDGACDILQQNRGLDEVTEIAITSQSRLEEVAELEMLVGDQVVGNRY